MNEFLGLFRKLWKHRFRLLLLSAAIYAGCAVLYFRATPQFVSVSKWISISQDPSSSTLQKFGSLLGGGISSQDDFTNYKDIIVSSEFLRPLLHRKVLVSGSPDSVQLVDVIRSKYYPNRPAGAAADAGAERELLVGMIGKMRGWVNFVSRSPIYQLRITTWDPVLSETFNEKIIERAIEYNGNERLGLSKRKRKYLETQLESFKSALLSSESQLLAFETKNISVQSPALLLEKSRLMREVQINSKLVGEFRTEYELARTEEDKEAVQISTLEPPSFSDSRTFPGKPLFFGGGLFCSLILSCLFFLLYEFALLLADEYRTRYGGARPK